MSQISQVIETVKRLLKNRNMTYRDLAEALKMSEANVKRMFSSHSFHLDRLEQICEILNLSLIDLFALSSKHSVKISQLTADQEAQLLSNTALLLVAVCVRDGWTFDEIIGQYDIDRHQAIQLLAQLDRLNIIELLPDNNYRSLIAQDFRWIPGGKLEQFMEQEVMVKFMQPKKGEPWMFRFYLRGRYSESSIDIIQRRLNQLTREAAELNQEDQTLPLEKRKHIGLLMAMRPWEPSIFENLKR